MNLLIGKLHEETEAIVRLLSHANDSSTAHGHTSLSHVIEGLETILVGAG
jgi:hypothetical protein